MRRVCCAAGVAALLLLCVAAAPASAQRPGPTKLESIVVPGSTDGASAVAFSHELKDDDDYRIVVRGVIDQWPSNGTGKPYTSDAAYCFDVPGFCDTPSFSAMLQWTVSQGDACQGFAGIPSSTPYNPQHVYQRDVTYPYDATLRFSVTDTSPADNTGSFIVELWELPSAAFKFYAVSCKNQKRYTNLSLPNGGCQSVRLVAEGPSGPEGAGIEVQVRRKKRWKALPVRCGAGLPPTKCTIIIDAQRPRTERYRALLRNPANGGTVIARRKVTVTYLAT